MNLLETISFAIRSVLGDASLVAVLPAGLWIISTFDKPIKWWVYAGPAVFGLAILACTDGWDILAFDRTWPQADAELALRVIWHRFNLRAVGVATGYVVGVLALWWWAAE